LNATSDIIINTTAWFHEFFNSEDGLVVLNLSRSELKARQDAENATNNTDNETNNETDNEPAPPTSGQTPANVLNITEESFQAIVAWIRVNVEREVYARCESCQANQTNATDSGNGTIGDGSGNAPDENTTTDDNTTTVDNSTVNDTGASNITEYNHTANFTSENYTLPASCNWSTDANDTVCCVEGLRSVCYNFTELTEFWDFSLPSTCDDVVNLHTDCQEPTFENESPEQCFRMKLFNKFQLHDEKEIYAWLYFDQPSAQTVYNECSNITTNWNLNFTEFTEGLQFNFGSL